MTSPFVPRAGVSIPPFLQPIAEQAAQQGLQLLMAWIMSQLNGLLQRKPTPPVLAPVDAPPAVPNVPSPIPAPLPSVPAAGEVGREVASVRLKVQKAQAPQRVNTGNDLNLYEPAQQDPYHVDAAIWADMTAFDDEAEEWQGHSIIAADLEYRTELEVYKNGSLVAFIRGRGGDDGKPNDWIQQIGGGVHFGFRAWKDSVGFNTRVMFSEEGDYELRGKVAGVPSNPLSLRFR